MRHYRHAVVRLLALLSVLALAPASGAQVLAPGTYPGYIIINPDGSQEIRAATSQGVVLHTVVLTAAGPGTVTGAGTYVTGATVTLTATASAGYTLQGWSGDAECTGLPFTIDHSVTCVGTFVPVPTTFTLTMLTDGTGSGITAPPVGTQTVLVGSTVTPVATPATGSVFTAWDPSLCAAPFAMPASNVTCTATFTADPTPPTPLVLTLETVGTGVVTGDGSYIPGAPVTLGATAGTGFTFSDWSPPPCAPLFAMPDTALTCLATFTADAPPPDQGATLAMTYLGAISDKVRDGNGLPSSMTPDGSNDGTWEVTLTGASRQIIGLSLTTTIGAGVRTWDTDVNTPDRSLGVALTSGGALINDTTTGRVNFIVANGGTFDLFNANTGEGNLDPGVTYTLTATFSDATTASATATTGGITTYALTLAQTGTGTGTVTGAGNYPAGATVTLTATGTNGSSFGGWSASPCAASFTMPASILTCTATFTAGTPTVRTLTVVASGPANSGVVSGAGSYLPGAAVTLTATPAAGFTFTGWSPSPCAPLFAMPDANLACTGSFSASSGPPPTGTGWSVISATGIFRFSWLNIAHDTTRGHLYALDWDGFLNRFNLATNGPWTQVNKPFSDGRHNCTLTFDATNSRLWLHQCAPASEDTQWYFNILTGAWAAASPTNNGSPGSSALAWYEPATPRLVGAGGWSGSMTGTVRTLALAGPSVAWGSISTASIPQSTDCERPAHQRGGFDAGRARGWFVAVDGTLWTFASNVWTQHATTGGPPPECTVYAYDQGKDTVVGWSGTNAASGGDPTSQIKGETWLLDVATLVWRLGPTISTGVTIPPINVMVTYGVAYDAPRTRVILLAGGSALTTYQFVVPPGTTPPPPTTFTLAIDTSGTGSGTVTGAGNYLAGTSVSVTASAAGGSTFTGWTGPSPCPSGTTSPTTILMPSAALTCGAVFTTSVPPPGGGGGGSITAGTFVARVLPSASASGPPFSALGGSKHTRFAFNPTNSKLYNGGGDWGSTQYTSSFNSSVWSYNVATDTWAMEEDYCGAPGELTPDHPDTEVFVWDSTRGQYLMSGPYFGTGGGTLCVSAAIPGSGSTYSRGLLAFDITAKSWSQVRTNGTGGQFGVYDSTSDEIISVQNAGCGNKVVHYKVSDATTRQYDSLCLTTYPGSPAGTYDDDPSARNDPWAWKQATRKGYMVFWVQHRVNFEVVSQSLRLYEYDSATGVVTRKADPPMPGGYVSATDASPAYYDSTHDRVLFPYSNSYCGVVQAMGVYNIGANTWSTEAVVTDPPGLTVRANSGGYDPVNDALLLGGSAFCGDGGTPALGAPTHLFLWRTP